jgi:hypothetical protein
MKHLKIFEDFNTFKKPSLFQKAVQAGKKIMGYEKKEDREELDRIYKAIGYRDQSTNKSFIDNVKEIKPGVILAWILGKSLTVDTNESSIIYNGRNLELTDMDYECDSLYQFLSGML